MTLKDGNVIKCSLPQLKRAPKQPFQIDGFPSLESLIEQFPLLPTAEGSEFQQAVWKEMQKIPCGQTRTYSEIAVAIGRPNAVRAVGAACGANPIPLFIPCHRVVAKNSLGGFSAGLPWKEMLLKMEGAL